jgi:DNA polymerase III subunit delta'
MGFERILGQAAATETLERALRTGKVHHAYRFEGPSGVGKEMAAFAFAQALVCTTPPPEGYVHRACGKCSACTRAITFSTEPPLVPLHPDVVLIERGIYSPEALHRSRPELQDISVDQIRRLVLERAGFPPHEGRARVYIVRRADELSLGAANALLKTLEEPGANTYFILLTARGNELLPTILSRTLVVRFGPLAESIVRAIIESKGTLSEAAKMAAELSGGSVEAALALADPEATGERRAFVDAALGAARASDLGAAIALSDSRARDKETLRDRLAALGAHLAGIGRTSAAEDPARAARAARGHGVVAQAIDELERNGSPALVLEAMVARLRHEL